MKNSRPVRDPRHSQQDRTVLVTGSSGFVDCHLYRSLLEADGIESLHGLDIAVPKEPRPPGFLRADIRLAEDLQRVARIVRPHTIFHLAAVAEVVLPFKIFPDLFDTNLSGTLNVLRAFRPKLVLSASTSAVYGNSSASGARPSWNAVRPVGIYGMSKAVGEMIGRDWARETGNVYLHFRFGNVTGPSCRGLIPYLVNHAKKYPRGSPPAQLRGHGRAIRDYVPIQYVIEVLLAAMRGDWRAGTSETFNVGTGRGMTNGKVCEIVQNFLQRRGYALSVDFDNPLRPGESQTVVLDMKNTTRKLAVPPPPKSAVVRAIEEATLSYLDAPLGGTAE
jgi:nucleoside-diphosphate-sugar epimerase